MYKAWNHLHNFDELTKINNSLRTAIEHIQYQAAAPNYLRPLANEGKFYELAKSALAPTLSNISMAAIVKKQSSFIDSSTSGLIDWQQQISDIFRPNSQMVEYAQSAAQFALPDAVEIMNKSVLSASQQQARLADNFAATVFAQTSAALSDDYFSKIVRELNSQYRDILTDIFRPIYDAPIGWRHWLPQNLEELGDEFDPEQIIDLVKEEPIPLYLVPRLKTSESLLRAPDKASRRSILNQRANTIIEDCESVIESIDSSHFADEIDQLSQAIDAYRNGLVRVSQSALATALDAITKSAVALSPGVTKAVTQQGNQHGERELEQIGIHGALVWSPIRRAFGRFNPEKGDKVPHEFSRHATVHSLEKRQYSKRNAIQALMLATSLLGYVNDLI